MTGVDLDGNLGIGRNIETICDGLVDCPELLVGKIHRGTAAVVNLPKRSTPPDQTRRAPDIFLKRDGIGRGSLRGTLGGVPLNHAIARAKLTERLAKRNMQIERKIVLTFAHRIARNHRRRLGTAHFTPPGRHRIGDVTRQRDARVPVKDLQIHFVGYG